MLLVTTLHHAEDGQLSQAWFWTPEWQVKEREADADFAAGRYKTFATLESFLADLDA